MVHKAKRVRDLKRSEKDFPRYREVIDTEGWVPHVVCDANGSYWDGGTVRDKNGQLPTGLSDAARKLMVNMILDGDFGEALKDVFVDPNRYYRIRDDLITWPNPEVIAREGLHELDVKRNT